MPNEINYTAVLADLEAKRADIDKAIAGVRQLLNLGSEQGTSNTGQKESSDQIQSDSFSDVSLPSAIRKLLEITKRPQSQSEITATLRGGGFKTNSTNFSSMVSTGLSRLKADGELVNIDGKWALASWYSGAKRADMGMRSGHTWKRSRSRTPLTAEQNERIKTLVSNGASLGEIARDLGLHHLKIVNSYIWRELHPK